MKNVIVVIFVVFLCALNIWGQAGAQISSSSESEEYKRPSVALVLSGAGPRGFAHIPILELFEELGIPIDLVVGTSSGAIVGGLYSAGYTGKELAETVLQIDWTELLLDNTTHLFTPALGSHSSTANLLNIQLSGDLSLNLGGGLLTGQYVYSKLKSLTAKIPSYIDFNDLPTPFRASGVNLLTGEYTIFDEGDLAEAMRASMTLPGVFEPFPIDGNFYLDGFIKNTLPIEAVREMGYDIVIAVEISDNMPEEGSVFNSNPVEVVNQVLVIIQEAVTSEEYQYADIVLFPDLTEFGATDYALAKEIYEKGQKEAEKYRDVLLDIRAKIFPDRLDSSNDAENSMHSDKIALIDDKEESFYRESVSYSDLPYIMVDDIEVTNAFPFDETEIRNEFEKIKERPISDVEIELLLQKAYLTGNYIMVTSRIDTRNNQSILELTFHPKSFESVQIGAAQLFEGVLSSTSSWEIKTIATVQFRNLFNVGGLISVQGSLLNKTGLEVLYFQPLSDKVYLRSLINGFQLIDIELPGFRQAEVKDSYFREGNATLAIGTFFTSEHTLLNEVGFHWVDSSQTSTVMGEGVFNVDDLDIFYAIDFFTRYTFDKLDYSMIPTSGFYSDITVMGVVPLSNIESPYVFEVLKADVIKAFSFSDNISLALNTFIGTNVSELLNTKPEFMTKYGFTTHDRTFFPHVTQRYTFGIHKFAFKSDLQFQPDRSLTVLGGQLFLGLGGAIGGVWNDYTSLASFESFEWQTSAFTGLRITKTIGSIIRVGAGSYGNKVQPFASLDFVIKYY